jgi:membrane dipeptidase
MALRLANSKYHKNLTPPGFVARPALLQTLEQIDIVHRMIKKYPHVFELAATSSDIKRIAAKGKIACMIGIEGGYSIQESLPILRRLYDRGCRYMTLTHSKSLNWADSATDKPKANGLSPFGEEVVREMNRIGMLIDLSHVSDQTMKHAIRISEAPVIFSHSSVRAINSHKRNVPDDVLKLVKKNNGVVMINFYSGYVAPDAEIEKNPKALGTLNGVVDHIEHVIKTIGVDHVGIGSDYDGVSRLPVGLESVATYPRITQQLLNRGYKKSDIHKILGGNVMRVLEEAEQVAKESR